MVFAGDHMRSKQKTFWMGNYIRVHQYFNMLHISLNGLVVELKFSFLTLFLPYYG